MVILWSMLLILLVAGFLALQSFLSPQALALAEPVVALVPAPFETIYNWSKDRCETWDVPDAPLRAFRNDRGEVIAFASDRNDRPFIGRDLSSLRHACQSAYQTKDSSNPADFSGWGYVTATWTVDGTVVEALVHDEFHAERFAGACAYKESMKCWYNVIVTARSTDGGHHFSSPDPPIVVAAPAFREDVEQGRHRGFFSPSNIVFHSGFYYTLIDTTGGGAQKPGGCLFRTRDIGDPSSWRAFSGGGFFSRAIDPYRGDASRSVPCEPAQGLAGPVNTMVWSRSARQFLGVMTVAPGPGHANGGVMYAWSSDLLHWSQPRLLLEPHPTSAAPCPYTERYGYASVIDPGSPSRNYDVIGPKPYLYVTRFHLTGCWDGPDRDLVRIPLEIR